MVNQNEKAISQIAEYIPRACRNMQLQEAKERLGKKIELYISDGCEPEILEAVFAPAMNSYTREAFFAATNAVAITSTDYCVTNQQGPIDEHG
ncbi:hypothetical protein QLG20_26495 [Klebsiella variicola]|uniref:hypothetical protein n=1 Tax=Klebsiella variicola TaxID=244366 RepID=UPI000F10B51E|nr:hypothetical protein [Klebsiella variicola]MDW0346123.1 hypothetical protein [Klebsiella variicola]WHE62708.1 hypothetical protein QLG20_26495 [Klebsiella variicola]VCW24133.1 hypothetical protein BANRA_02091 [Klebsiella variicola]